MKAWVINEEKIEGVDLRNELQHRKVQWVSQKELQDIGISVCQEDPQNKGWFGTIVEKCKDVEAVCYNEENYEQSREELTAGSEKEEIVNVLKGSGYFDVRDGNNRFF